MSQLKRLWTSVTTGLGSLLRKAVGLLGAGPSSARRPAPAPAAPAVKVRAPLVSPDALPLVVTGGIVLAGCCLAAATIIAGRRRG